MLIFDFAQIGNKLLAIRKRAGLTQMEVAEAAGLSNRTYADIERGMVNMRIETILRICEALYITPDEILTQHESGLIKKQEELIGRLNICSEKDRNTALELLDVYLRSLSKPDKARATKIDHDASLTAVQARLCACIYLYRSFFPPGNYPHAPPVPSCLSGFVSPNLFQSGLFFARLYQIVPSHGGTKRVPSRVLCVRARYGAGRRPVRKSVALTNKRRNHP